VNAANDPAAGGEWLFATGTRAGAPLLARVRSQAPTDAERANNPRLVIIAWRFDSEAGQLPDEADLDTMAAFENALFDAMDSGDWGIGAAVVTCDGVREWRIYTQDFERFQHGLNDALAGQPHHPLEFQTFDDPDWDAYHQILG
jgi:hypothetical protein